MLVIVAIAGWQAAQPRPLSELLAETTSSIHGRVTFRETGKPVVGATIRPMTWSCNGVASTVGTTDRSGCYSVRALPMDWELSVLLPAALASSYTSVGAVNIHLGKGEVKIVDLVVFKGIPVSGSVTLPDGKPAVGGYVQARFVGRGSTLPLSPYLATVSPSGSYRLNLPPGSFSLYAQSGAGGPGFYKESRVFNATSAIHQDLKLEADGELIKRVRKYQRG